MTKKEWGSKHICENCAAKYYDMQKTPATCPKCGTVDEGPKPTAKKRAIAKEKSEEAVAEPVVDEVIVDEDEDDLDDDVALLPDDDDDDEFEEEDNGLMEDASDLIDEEEDLTEAKEHMEPNDKE